jgi:hypothetical protein
MVGLKLSGNRSITYIYWFWPKSNFFLKLNEMGEVRWDKVIGEIFKRDGGMVEYLIFSISKRLFFGWQGVFLMMCKGVLVISKINRLSFFFFSPPFFYGVGC